MHSKSDNMEAMIYGEGDEVLKELLDSLKNKYPDNLPFIIFIYCNINVIRSIQIVVDQI